MDDITLSSDDKGTLEATYAALRRALDDGNFSINKTKTQGPAEAIDVFNCALTQRHTSVLQARRDEFYQIERSAASSAAFAMYCGQVEAGNALAPMSEAT